MIERLRIHLLGGTDQIGGALKAALVPFVDVSAPTSTRWIVRRLIVCAS